MKRAFLQRIIAPLLLLCLLSFISTLSACSSFQLRSYYSERSNYVVATGTVSYISYSEDKTSLYIEFSDLSPKFDDICFKIVGDNLAIVQANGIDQSVAVGSYVEFITAPEYFGDGYVMPIVAMSINDVPLLEFEDGLDNLLEWIDET